MNGKFSFYLERQNKLFNGDVLSICYEASEEEKKKYHLTSNNIVIFIKSDKINNIVENSDFDYFNRISEIISDDVELLRIQSECFLGMYGDSHCDCEDQRLKSIKLISENNGIFVHLPQEAQGWGLHYKLKELELQVSGRMQDGEFIGIKNRDSAQKILLHSDSFNDNRSYEIVANIFKNLNIHNRKFALITDSDNKLTSLKNYDLNVIKYSDFICKNVTVDNASEYLVKILNLTHDFDNQTIDKLIEFIRSRKYNERTLNVLLNIIDRIKNDSNYKLSNELKQKFLNLYNEIICGSEKRYIIGDEKYVKVQNNFSSRVNSTIFKSLCMIFGMNIFDRISLEKVYYFKNKNTLETVRIRTSEILDNIEEKCKMFKNQIHVEQSTYNETKNKVVQKEISISTLRSFFENSQYDYIKRVEMVTIISEGIIPDLNIYIKRLPNTENRVMNIFGKSESIKSLIDNIMKINSVALLNVINDEELSNQNFSNYNLRFSDINAIIEEETRMYLLTKEEQGNGIRNKILLPNRDVR